MSFTSLLPRAAAFAAAAAVLPVSAFAQGDCATAASVVFDAPQPFDNSATGESWFVFTPSADYTTTISTCNMAMFDTRITVYDGDCMTLNQVAFNDDNPGAGCTGFTSLLDLAVTSGTTYYIEVDGFGGATGTGDLLVTGPPPPPDECVDAAPIVPGVPEPIDTTVATSSMPPFSCSAGGDPTSPDLWYMFTASTDWTATIGTCGTVTYDSKVEVYSGSCGALVSEACNDDFTGCAGFSSQVDVALTAGTDYYVRVGGWRETSTGTGTLLVTAPPPAVANDECSGALPLMNGVAEMFDNTAATNSAGPLEFSCGGTPANALDLWYTIIPTQTGTVMVDTFGSSFDTRLEAYEGDCGALVSLDCNDDSGGLQSMVSFSGVAGQVYYIRVAGFSGNSGTGVINSSFADSFPNDDCAGAAPVGLGSTPYYNVGATDSGLNISCAVGSSVGSESDLFFSYTANATCTIVVDTLGSEHDTTLAAYTGTCGALTEVACDDDFFGSAGGFLSQMIFEATAGETYIIQAGTWNNDTGAGSLNISILDGPGIADPICAGVPNSTGEAGTLRAEGSLVAGDNDLTFEARCLPANQNGLLVNSIVPGVTVMNAGGGAGTLCIASFQMGRHPIVSSGAGSVSFQVDTTSIPNQSALIAAMAGDTIYWQFWHRDLDMAGAQTSNFTGAVSTTFQ